MQDWCCSLQTNACRQFHGGKHVCSKSLVFIFSDTDWLLERSAEFSPSMQQCETAAAEKKDRATRSRHCCDRSHVWAVHAASKWNTGSDATSGESEDQLGTTWRRNVNHGSGREARGQPPGFRGFADKGRGKTNNGQLLFFFFFLLRESLAGSDSQAFNWIRKMFAEQVVMAAATLQRDNTPL